MNITNEILAYVARLKSLEGRTMKLHELHDILRGFRAVYPDSIGWYYTDEDYDTDDEGNKLTGDGECLDMIHSADCVSGLDRCDFHVEGQPLFEVFFIDRNNGNGWRDPENDVTIDDVQVWCYPKKYEPERDSCRYTVLYGDAEMNEFLLTKKDAEELAESCIRNGMEHVSVVDVFANFKVI